jgi:hypothetical protein
MNMFISSVTEKETLGHAAIELQQRWLAHEAGAVAAANTLLAVFAAASPEGRFAGRFLNPSYPVWLTDIAYKHRVEVPPIRHHVSARPASPTGRRTTTREHVPRGAAAHRSSAAQRRLL